MRSFLFLAAAIAAVSVQAATNAANVPALTSPATPSLVSLMQMIFALMLVLAAIIGTAWLFRRFGPTQLGGSAQMRVIGGVMVGPKERVVIVEVRDTWLVLGVTTVEVTNLHTLPRPDDAAPTTAVAHPFAQRLAAIMQRRSAPAAQAAPLQSDSMQSGSAQPDSTGDEKAST